MKEPFLKLGFYKYFSSVVSSLASEASGALLSSVAPWNLPASLSSHVATVDQHWGTSDLESALHKSQLEVNPMWSLSCQPSGETVSPSVCLATPLLGDLPSGYGQQWVRLRCSLSFALNAVC